MATTYMSLTLPTPSVTIGPQWATELNAALTVIDSHDHSSGKGVQIKTNGLNIDANLSFNSYAATDLLKTQYTDQASALSGASNLYSVYTVNGDLYYTNGAGTAVQVTDGTGLSTVTIPFNTIATQTVSTNLTISSSDTFVYLLVDTTAARAITLPAAADVDAGRFYIVKDVTGSALTYNITVNRAGSDLIDGATSFVMNSNYGSIWIVSDGTSAWSIS